MEAEDWIVVHIATQLSNRFSSVRPRTIGSNHGVGGVRALVPKHAEVLLSRKLNQTLLLLPEQCLAWWLTAIGECLWMDGLETHCKTFCRATIHLPAFTKLILTDFATLLYADYLVPWATVNATNLLITPLLIGGSCYFSCSDIMEILLHFITIPLLL